MLSLLIPRPNVWEIVNSRQTKTSDLWIGSVESIIALAYKRFRPGAKLKISNFRITNDHRHNIRLFRYQFNLQSVKRTMCGGKAVDMYNLKHPIYFCEDMLRLLPPRDRRFLISLAIQGLENLLSETYAKDEIAKECLHQLRLILDILEENTCKDENGESDDSGSMDSMSIVINADADDSVNAKSESEPKTPPTQPDQSEPGPKAKKDHINKCGVCDDLYRQRSVLRITHKYMDNPLTKKNRELWREKKYELRRICQLFRRAEEKVNVGKETEEFLSEIKKILEPINDKMYDFYKDIIEGK